MLNLVIDIKRIVQLAAVAVLLCFAVQAEAQAPSPRKLNDDQVQRMLDNERWTFGRENLRSNRKNNSSNNAGSPNSGGGSGTGSTSNRDTRSNRNSNGNGEYYWDDSNSPEGGSNNNSQVDPNDIRDPNNGMNEPGSEDNSYSPPPPSSNPYEPSIPSAPTDSTAVIGVLKYVLIGVGILLLVYIILQAKGTGVFKGKKAKVQEDSDYVDFEEEDIHEIEFVDEIELAVRNGDFRKAIRLRFLNVLKDLSDVSLIRWKINKTNYDYIGELSGHKVQNSFMNLTTVYEYCWYGEFNISEGLYHKVADEFNQFNTDMNEVAKG